MHSSLVCLVSMGDQYDDYWMDPSNLEKPTEGEMADLDPFTLELPTEGEMNFG